MNAAAYRHIASNQDKGQAIDLTGQALMILFKGLNRKRMLVAALFLALSSTPAILSAGLSLNDQSPEGDVVSEPASHGATPLLSLTRNLDVALSWNAESGILAISSAKGSLFLMPGNRHIITDKAVITLDRAPFFSNGELMVDEGFVDILLTLLSSSPPSSRAGTVFTPSSEPGASSHKDRVDRVFKTIVIDPGHGGRDAGAVSPWGVMEKDLVLQIAREVKDIIDDKMGIRVLLTRDGDYFVPLEERTRIAAGVNADLFISIHANSTKGRRIQGIETYFMSPDASDEDAMAAAEKENAVIKLEGKAFEANGDLAFILMDMSQTEHIIASSRFAMLLHENLGHVLNTTDRGVKQAPFIVLARASMPAVLLEVGFLSNRSETIRLQGKDTQKKIADAIFRSVRIFKESVESKFSSRHD